MKEHALITLEDWRRGMLAAKVTSSDQPSLLPVPLKVEGEDEEINLSTAVPVETFVASVERATESGPRARRFVISDSGVDRHGDVVAASGWSLDNYLRNPVVLWAHDRWTPPIGKALSVKKGAVLESVTEFATHELASTILELVDGGFLSATSVGFRPLKYLWNAERGGYDFAEQELLEYSIVNVPANPRALRKAADGGVNLAPLRAWSLRTLEADLGEDAIVIPVSRVEALCRELGWSHGRKLFEIPVTSLREEAKASLAPAVPEPVAQPEKVAPAAPAPPSRIVRKFVVAPAVLQRAVAEFTEPFQAAVTRVTGQIFVP